MFLLSPAFKEDETKLILCSKLLGRLGCREITMVSKLSRLRERIRAAGRIERSTGPDELRRRLILTAPLAMTEVEAALSERTGEEAPLERNEAASSESNGAELPVKTGTAVRARCFRLSSPANQKYHFQEIGSVV